MARIPLDTTRLASLASRIDVAESDIARFQAVRDAADADLVRAKLALADLKTTFAQLVESYVKR